MGEQATLCASFVFCLKFSPKNLSAITMKTSLRVLFMLALAAFVCAADIASEVDVSGADALLDEVEAQKVDPVVGLLSSASTSDDSVEIAADSDLSYWYASQAAYQSGPEKAEGKTFQNWKVEKICESHVTLFGHDMGSAVAKFLTHTTSNEKVLAFAGSDDAVDWAHNLNAGSEHWQGSSVHAGFRKYVMELEGCIEAHYNSYNPAKMVGHSLGGAAASLYALKKGKKTTHTFGAPPTIWEGAGGNCRIGGRRILHYRDPVGGLQGCIGFRAFGLCVGIDLDKLKHDVKGFKVTDSAKPTSAGCNYKSTFSWDTLKGVADMADDNNAHMAYAGDVQLLEDTHFGGAKTTLFETAPGRRFRSIDYGHYLSKQS